MYTNNRRKPKEPEINTLRCGSMAAWNTGNGTRLQQEPAKSYIETLTQQYNEIQHQNYLTYQMEVLRSTNPLGLGLGMPDRSIISKIESLPPGRPPAKEPAIEKPKAMTYFEHRRMREMAENPEGYEASSHASDGPVSSNNGYQNRDNSRGGGHRGTRGGFAGGRNDRGSNSYAKRPKEKVSSGWSDEEDEKPVAKHVKTNSNDDWDDFLPPQSEAAPKKGADDWDSGTSAKSSQKPASDGDDWDCGATISAPVRKAPVPQADDDWDSFLPTTSIKKEASKDDFEEKPSSSTSAKPPVAKNDDDWDDSAPVQVATKQRSCQKDDWSDDEKPASTSYRQDSSSYRHSDSGSSRGRGAHSGNSYRGSSRSRDSSSFSRSREGSSDRYRSASRTSNRSDGSGGSNQTPYVRQPRPGDWDCSKCKKNNFSHRTDCFRCHEPKDENATSSYVPSQSNGNGGQRPPRQPRPDDWNCTNCKKVNFGNRTECFSCSEPKGENPTNDAGPSAMCIHRPPRQPRPDDWNCPSCRGLNFGHRTDCFRCHEPKDENSSGGNSASGSYRGSSRGGYGGNRRGGSNSFGGKRSFDSTPAASSGWSDEEEEKPKKATAVVLSGGDDWDTEKSPVKVAPKVQLGGDDDWDSPSVPFTVSALPATSTLNNDDDWDSFSKPAKIAPAEVVPKLKGNDDDEWAGLDAPVSIPQAGAPTKRKSEDDDEWASFETPAKISKISVDNGSAGDVDGAKGEETFDEPSSSTNDDDVVVKVSDANDDDSWEKSDKSVADERDATDTTGSDAAGKGDSWPSPNEVCNEKVAEAKAIDDEDW